MASENVLKEVDIALEWKKRIVPVDLEKVPLTRDFMYHLVGLQRVDVNDFDAIYRACTKTGDAAPVISPQQSGKVDDPSREQHTSASGGAIRQIANHLRAWPLRSWLVFAFCLLAAIEVGEALIHNGQVGQPNADWLQGTEVIRLAEVTPVGLAEGLRNGDTMVRFDNVPLGKSEQGDAFYDAMKRHRPGDTVSIVVRRSGLDYLILDRLRSNPMDAGLWYAVLAFGLMITFIVLFSLYAQPKNPQVAPLCVFLATGVMWFAAPFSIPLPKTGIGWPGILTLMGPLMTFEGAFLLHFASYFLRQRQRQWLVWFAYVFTIPHFFSYAYNAVVCLSRTDYSGFVGMPCYLIPAQVSTGTLLLIAIVVMVVGYIQTTERGLRKRIRLVLWSVCFSAMAFVVVGVLPILGVIPWLANGTIILISCFFLTVLCIAIGVTLNQAFDTDIIINKSIVYAGVLVVLLLVYEGMAYGLTRLFGGDDRTSAWFATILLAMLFEPAKRRAQAFVDRRFFKVSFNFREAEREAAAALTHTGSVLEAGEYVVRVLTTVLPTETAGFYTINQNSGITFVSSANPNEPDRYRDMGEEVHRRMIEFGPEAWDRPVGLPDLLEPQVKAYGVEDDLLRKLGAALLVPVKNPEGGLKAFFLSGKKTTGWKYSADDIDLLQSLSVLTSHALARIEHNLQAQVREAERERFERRKRMKSISGSSLPHEVWVMGDNIQIFRAIEKKQLGLEPRPVDFDALVQTSIQSLGSDLMMEQFELGLDLRAGIEGTPATVHIDPKLMEQAIRTLLSHAMKYSVSSRGIEVSTTCSDGFVNLAVCDHGVGISSEDQKHVFEPFSRGSHKEIRPAGAGLGMYIVKHIVEASGGSVEVQSTIGQGTTVSLNLPTSVA